ncbi:hypothetical protein AYO37_00535 [Opitutia bacterium SCGC AG-212-L18]|nr:hypothetical protein AYO37_00535 [Opitutae bacterium SCGC AG-212-L18]
MGNINSQIPPYRPADKKLAKEVKGLASSSETQAASTAAGAAQASEAAIKAFLIEKFGDKIGNKIFDAIPTKDKIGKDLSFESVRAAIERNTGTMGDRLKAELQSLYTPEEEPTRLDESNPHKYIEDAIAFQQKARAEMARAQDAHDERMLDAKIKEDVEKKEEIKQEQVKKIFNPKNFPEV